MYVSQTRSGIVVDPGDYEGLRRAILFLFENKDAWEKLGKAGRDYVEKNLSCKSIGLRMEEVFRNASVPQARKADRAIPRRI